jgi:hypothetical protein
MQAFLCSMDCVAVTKAKITFGKELLVLTPKANLIKIRPVPVVSKIKHAEWQTVRHNFLIIRSFYILCEKQNIKA